MIRPCGRRNHPRVQSRARAGRNNASPPVSNGQATFRRTDVDMTFRDFQRDFVSRHLPKATQGVSFTQTNLVSDGAVPAAVIDPNLVNPWGVSFGPTSPFWVSDNGTGVTTLYNGAGTPLAAAGNTAITIAGPA